TPSGGPRLLRDRMQDLVSASDETLFSDGPGLLDEVAAKYWEVARTRSISEQILERHSGSERVAAMILDVAEARLGARNASKHATGTLGFVLAVLRYSTGTQRTR